MGSSRGNKHARARVGRTEVSPRRERQTTVEGRGCSLTLPLSPPTHSPTHCQPQARQSTPSPPDHVTCIPSKTESLGWKMEKFASRWCCTCMLHGRDVTGHQFGYLACERISHPSERCPSHSDLSLLGDHYSFRCLGSIYSGRGCATRRQSSFQTLCVAHMGSMTTPRWRALNTKT